MTRFVPGGPARFAHQRRGLSKIIDTGGCAALLYDPGLGKTAVVIDYLSLLALKSPSGEARAMVVAPLAAVDTWVDQCSVFASPQVEVWAEALGGSIVQRGEALASRGGSPFAKQFTGGRPSQERPTRAHHSARSIAFWTSGGATAGAGPDSMGSDLPRLVLCVVNIDTFTSRARIKGYPTMADYLLESVRRFAPDVVVIDESHRIKSVNGNASRCLARMVPFVKRRILLTGTVMPHSPLDVFAQWRFLDPYAFGSVNASDGSRRKATFTGFRTRYAVIGGFQGRQVTGFRNLDDMQDVMARNAVVARKKDALDLPPVTDVEVPVELTARERNAYREMRDQLAASLSGQAQATVPNRLAQMLRLRQITSGHLPDDSGRVHIIGDSKARTIASIVDDNLAGESRVVVFCFFSWEIETVRRYLSTSRASRVEVITGDTPPEERAAIRKRFGSSDPSRIVLIAQIKTMSLAVNELVTASHAVFGSLSQQRDDLIQAMARLDRQGQRNPVTFWYALAKGTVDTVIMQSHRDRTDLESAMLQHIHGERRRS